MFSDEIVDSLLFIKFHRSGPGKIFSFSTIMEHISYSSKKTPNHAKDLINMVSVTPDGLWMVSDRIVKSRFFVKFHRSRPAIIFRFSIIMEHVSNP